MIELDLTLQRALPPQRKARIFEELWELHPDIRIHEMAGKEDHEPGSIHCCVKGLAGLGPASLPDTTSPGYELMRRVALVLYRNGKPEATLVRVTDGNGQESLIQFF